MDLLWICILNHNSFGWGPSGFEANVVCKCWKEKYGQFAMWPTTVKCICIMYMVHVSIRTIGYRVHFYHNFVLLMNQNTDAVTIPLSTLWTHQIHHEKVTAQKFCTISSTANEIRFKRFGKELSRFKDELLWVEICPVAHSWLQTHMNTGSIRITAMNVRYLCIVQWAMCLSRKHSISNNNNQFDAMELPTIDRFLSLQYIEIWYIITMRVIMDAGAGRTIILLNASSLRIVGKMLNVWELLQSCIDGWYGFVNSRNLQNE